MTKKKVATKKKTQRKTKEEYVKDSSKCPFCGSDQIKGDSFTVDGPTAYQEVSCIDCEKEWYDDYKLVGYTPLART